MASPATIRYKQDEILLMKRRLRLSDGDMLSLSREIAEDSGLVSPDHLSELQQGFLLFLLKWLAQPAALPEEFAA